jgi:5-methyltetrahydrofolate--homocysteine methyltransferase
VHVLDASKSVPVAGDLVSDVNKEEFAKKVKLEYEALAIDHQNRKKDKNYVRFSEAVDNGLKIDWNSFKPLTPSFLGNKVFESYDLAEIATYIDWTPFFQTWMLKGKYPNILRDPVVGVEAKKLHADALAMLSKIIDGKLLQANATIGFYPVKRDGETARIFTEESCTDELKRFHFLRQQGKKSSGVPNISLVDFLAPASTKSHDYIGGFAVTTGIGIEKLVVQHEKNHDDYSIIMVKALADRLAEAFAELMHARVRREFWGYAADESLDNELLIRLSCLSRPYRKANAL